MTDYTKGDLIILDGDKIYDLIIWNNPVDIVEKYEKLNSHYIDRDNICLLYTSRCV